MTEMTVRQHNEQLILEKMQMQAAYREERAITARVIAALMGRYKTKTITPEQLTINDVVIQFTPSDDGLVITKNTKPQQEAA